MTKEAKKFLAWKEKQNLPELLKQKDYEIQELKERLAICKMTIKAQKEKVGKMERKIEFLTSNASVLSTQKSINCGTAKKMINKITGL